MGKSLEELNLGDEPLRSVDLRDETWYQFACEIDEMIAVDEYYWALDTLEGIRKSVEARKLVTDGQRRAVENIKAARQGRREGGYRRRYEGWGR